MVKRLSVPLLVLALLHVGSALGQQAQQYPILDRIADKVISLGTFIRDFDLAARLEKRRHRIEALRAAANDPVLALRAKVEDATLAAVRAYQPRAYPGRVALFLPSRKWRDADGWRRVVPHAEEYAGPDGCGSQEMLREPNTAAFATLFETAAGLK